MLADSKSFFLTEFLGASPGELSTLSTSSSRDSSSFSSCGQLTQLPWPAHPAPMASSPRSCGQLTQLPYPDYPPPVASSTSPIASSISSLGLLT
ncbi:hypothetical protein PCANC_25593 [Puccinia coronata f. sp. avenae]|uniref:Uncharacterized protein n=1 Tax=Puccinia coronata f. sp. avenae TaxID=200324 RepID=A0A2N5TMM2_9BASI|nr:hypothetical protein PCANC_25593 [Puccinia coronata f. sp. avenae]